MIDKITGFVADSINWWHDFLGPLCAPTPVFTIAGVVGVIALFFILRWQHKNWGNMWAGEGILEFGASSCISLIITGAFYMLPFVLFCCAASAIALVFMAGITKLVKVSLGEY